MSPAARRPLSHAATACALALALSSCAKDAAAPSTPASPPKPSPTAPAPVAVSNATAVVKLSARSGSTATGEIEFFDGGAEGVTLRGSFTGLTPGSHAIHIHEVGDCSAEDGTSAGPHWNPHGKPHGAPGQEDGMHHAGDLGNLEAGPDGTATLKMLVTWLNFKDGDPANPLGKSVIVHEKVDDFTTQPAGNAGARIACGVIAKP